MASVSKNSKVEELLPWYVNDTLTQHEREIVEQGLEDDAELREEEKLLRELRDSIKAGAAKSPGEFGLKRLQKQISDDRIKLVDTQQTWWRPMAIAATIAVLLQAGVLVNLWYTPPDAVYAPLSSNGSTSSSIRGPVLQMSFVPNASEAEIRALLQKYGAEIVAGPGSLGIYRVQLPVDPNFEAKLKVVIADLKVQTTVVSHVQQE